ncbi:MAG: hypothetical protein NZ551_08400 [Microscillaceae bacterium]|nr:hypothetical protein [Microscillaceae bacterium]MDW8461219.1 hypothetical protein [Cytophagales bacterium]
MRHFFAKMYHFLVLCLALLGLVALQVGYAQTSEEEEELNNEFTYGINFHTNGGFIGGFNFKYAKKLTANRWATWGVELVGVKHPQEQRVTYLYSPFILNKQNYLYSLRLLYGRDIVLFHKAPEEGAKVSLCSAGGLTLGIVKPYYIQYYPRNTNIPQSVPYNPSIHSQGQIGGAGGVFEGISESKIVPGIYLKTGLAFEFGTFRNTISGFEAGLNFEAFSQKIIILPTNPNYNVFTAAYLMFFFGTRR